MKKRLRKPPCCPQEGEEAREARLCHNETPPRGPHRRLPPLPDSTGAFNFERPCYLRGGICLKRGTPNCEPFRGPCRAFTVCCKVKGSGRKWSSQGTLAPEPKAAPLVKQRASLINQLFYP
ncbi:hypothetical protein VULLAG_LOCUS4972 [Vulpes lagopus]